MWPAVLLYLSTYVAPGLSKLVRHDDTFHPDHILRVTDGSQAAACETRHSFLVNGSSPGPPIRIPAGKVSWIRVYNDAKHANVTMHWHGLSQRAAPFADGTPSLAQFTIPPGSFFDNEIFPGAYDKGTYFYHSHVDLQAQTAFGPLIVEDGPHPPYDYDEERIVAFSDYYNRTDDVMLAGLTANPFRWQGETNAVLVNGQGVSNTITRGSASCQRPALDVECGKTYRVRFIGATALSLVSWKIEEHSMTIIAADGRYTQPYEVEHLQIASGQRFDALLRTKSCSTLAQQPRKTFWAKFESKGRKVIYTGYAALRYAREPVPFDPPPSAQALVLPDTLYDWLEYSLKPLVPNQFPSAEEVTRRLTITVQQYGSPNATIKWAQNGLSWTEAVPHEAILPAIYKHGQSAMPDFARAVANNGWDPETLIWPAKTGEVLEILLVNTGSEVANSGTIDNHSFHRHAGHHFDAGFGCGVYNATANEARLATSTPVLRDTTVLYRCNATGGPGQPVSWRLWRVRATEPGVWLTHCHTLPHMPMGMQMAWVVGTADEIRKIPLGVAEGYFTYGGSVVGNASQVPVMYHYFEDKPEMPWN